MSIKKTSLIIITALLFFSFLAVNTLAAENRALEGLNTTKQTAGISDLPEPTATDIGLGRMVGRALNYVLGILGVIFVTIILIGGYLWMAATGKEEEIKKAKTVILNGVFGMTIIFITYALVSLILYAVKTATGG